MIKMIASRAGDTIIEVLIAIGVMSLVLGGAFSISNRSSISIQDSQEHTEALKIAQSQVEQLKQISDNNPGGFDSNLPHKTIYDTTLSDFCINNGKIDNVCNFTSLGGFPYTVKINITTPAGPDPKPYTYTVAVTWDALNGGKDNVTLYYNLDSKNGP